MPVGRPRQAVPDHGTRQRYQHRTDPCHCPQCSRANAGYQAVYRANASAPAPSIGRPKWEQLQIPAHAYEHVGRRA